MSYIQELENQIKSSKKFENVTLFLLVPTVILAGICLYLFKEKYISVYYMFAGIAPAGLVGSANQLVMLKIFALKNRLKSELKRKT